MNFACLPLLFLPLIVLLAWISLIFLVRTVFPPLTNPKIEFNATENTNKPISALPKKTNSVMINYHVPKFMLELYENNKSGLGAGKARKESSGVRADVVRSLIPKHATQFDNTNQNHLLVFDLPSSVEQEEFVSAELKILTLVQINSKIDGLERQLKVSVYDDTTHSLYGLEKIHIFHMNNTWVTFNVTQPVDSILQRMRNHQKSVLKLVISVRAFYNETNTMSLSLMPPKEDFEHDYPVLLLSYASKRNEMINKNNASPRRKRSLEEDYEEETNNVWDDEAGKKSAWSSKKQKRSRHTCRKKPLYVNFAEIEYDLWIVQPRGYEAYQCQGKCFFPVAEHLSPTKHAIVQALLHSVAPAKAARTCCVPTALDSISILYVDASGVLTYRYAYKEMVVVECGCR